jgi:hypothetical protein
MHEPEPVDRRAELAAVADGVDVIDGLGAARPRGRRVVDRFAAPLAETIGASAQSGKDSAPVGVPLTRADSPGASSAIALARCHV